MMRKGFINTHAGRAHLRQEAFRTMRVVCAIASLLLCAAHEKLGRNVLQKQLTPKDEKYVGMNTTQLFQVANQHRLGAKTAPDDNQECGSVLADYCLKARSSTPACGARLDTIAWPGMDTPSLPSARAPVLCVGGSAPTLTPRRGT